MKKAEVDPMHVIVGAIIILIVLVVMVITFTKFFGQGAKTTKCELDRLSCDADCDGVKNPVDKCPCDPFNNEATCKKTDDSCYDYKQCKCKPVAGCSAE